MVFLTARPQSKPPLEHAEQIFVNFMARVRRLDLLMWFCLYVSVITACTQVRQSLTGLHVYPFVGLSCMTRSKKTNVCTRIQIRDSREFLCTKATTQIELGRPVFAAWLPHGLHYSFIADNGSHSIISWDLCSCRLHAVKLDNIL